MKPEQVPCKYHISEIYKQLKILEYKGYIESYRAKGLDLKEVLGHRYVSVDIYHYWRAR